MLTRELPSEKGFGSIAPSGKALRKVRIQHLWLQDQQAAVRDFEGSDQDSCHESVSQWR
jgi:hypothetical protein